MTAEDELALPQVPEALPEDPEDVSWALSTAEAMWARGDHLEGIKWIRKAAEAASEVEDDARALALAKAASDLTTLIARRSRASLPEGGGLAGGAPPEPMPNSVPMSVPVPMSVQQPQSQAGPPMSAPPMSHPHPSAQPTSHKPPSIAPNTSRMGNAPPIPASLPPSAPAPLSPHPHATPQAPPAGMPITSPSRPVMTRSGPPIGRAGAIPLPSRASAAPPKPASGPGSGAPRPLAAEPTGRSGLSNRPPPASAKKSGRRRSRENLDAEAAAAGTLDTAPQTAVDGDSADRALGQTVTDGGAVEVPVQDARVRRSGRPEPDPTVIARLDDLAASLTQEGAHSGEYEREKSAEEWDASPTQNLTGDDLDHLDRMSQGDRKTAMAVQIPVVAAPPVRAPMGTVHDPEIQTSQAVRVVVWRDGNGVHVAPAGTVVSSITIDAVLVVLEPTADLTAWLSQR